MTQAVQWGEQKLETKKHHYLIKPFVYEWQEYVSCFITIVWTLQLPEWLKSLSWRSTFEFYLPLLLVIQLSVWSLCSQETGESGWTWKKNTRHSFMNSISHSFPSLSASQTTSLLHTGHYPLTHRRYHALSISDDSFTSSRSLCDGSKEVWTGNGCTTGTR